MFKSTQFSFGFSMKEKDVICNDGVSNKFVSRIYTDSVIIHICVAFILLSRVLRLCIQNTGFNSYLQYLQQLVMARHVVHGIVGCLATGVAKVPDRWKHSIKQNICYNKYITIFEL